MPRLPKQYKNQLEQLDQEKRDEARLRQKLFPLRITQKASISRTRKEKIGRRLLELSDLYDIWRVSAIRNFDKQPEIPVIPNDLFKTHELNEQWYHDPAPYKFDVSVLMNKLIINVNWAQDHGEPNFVSFNAWQFPTMDPILGEGPVVPALDAVFDQHDEHMVVSEGRDLFFVPFHNREIEDVWYMELDR